jgi:hypothetical protein
VIKITEDFDDYFIVKAVDENGRLRWRRDGTARIADSRYCKDPYEEVEKPGGQPIKYSSKGIV